MVTRYEIRRAKNNEFFFVLIAGNNEIILTSSETYTSKQGCENGIESVQENSSIDSRYERRIANDKSYYSFYLRSYNNARILGRSETYKTRAGRENGIESVKTNGKTTRIDDES